MHNNTKIIIRLNRVRHFVFFVYFNPLLINSQDNSGFDNWSILNGHNKTNNWHTLNVLSLFGSNPVSAFKVSNTDKYSSNSALKIIDKKINA